MKHLFILMTALVLALVSSAFCQGDEKLYPDEYTRKTARQVDLKSVKEIQLYLEDGREQPLVVTDSKTIALLVEGLKNATETGISNQVSGVEVVDKNGKSLVWANFSLDYPSHALSPEFIEGLKAAGVEPQAWKEREQREKAQKETRQQLMKWAPPSVILALLAIFVFTRRAKRQI